MPNFANSYYATGHATGLVEGEVRCIVIGNVEGEARGEVRGIIKTKFGQVPLRVGERLSEIADLVVLQSLAVTADESKTLEEFEAALGGCVTPCQ